MVRESAYTSQRSFVDSLSLDRLRYTLCVRSSSTELRYIDYILAIAVRFDLTHVKTATGQYQIASHFCSSSILQHPARHTADASKKSIGTFHDSADFLTLA